MHFCWYNIVLNYLLHLNFDSFAINFFPECCFTQTNVEHCFIVLLSGREYILPSTLSSIDINLIQTSKTTFSFIFLGFQLHQFDFLRDIWKKLVCSQSELGKKIYCTNYRFVEKSIIQSLQSPRKFILGGKNRKTIANSTWNCSQIWHVEFGI